MRRFLLLGSFLALLAGLCALWAFRFQRLPGFPTWRLADLRVHAPSMPGLDWIGSEDHPTLRVKVDSETPRVAVRLAIPGVPAMEMLHLRFRLSAHGLAPGKEKWEDGRFMVEWHPPSGDHAVEEDLVGSIRFDERSEWVELVAHPLRGPAVPALRIEHLGSAGEYEISDLEITALEERAVWKIGKWFLAFAWFGWCVACIRSWPGIPWRRALCAAGIWLLMGIHFAIPGPWKAQRAMIPAFQIGKDSMGTALPGPAPVIAESGEPPLILTSQPLPALGQLPNQGSFALRVKLQIARARPFLHVLLLFAPALAFVVLLGRHPMLFLSIIMALAIEAAQVAFGYGFDWVDIFDLACDATGIALAMWTCEILKKRGFFAWIIAESHRPDANDS